MSTTIDFDARYSVVDMPGVAWWIKEHVTDMHEVEWTEEHDGETVYLYDVVPHTDESRVIAVMVGDDREHIIDVDDLTKLDEEDYCHQCGQIGCTHDGR